MNSPDLYQIYKNIALKKDTQEPIYLQLANELVKLIQLGYLPNNYKFPGSRQLAKIFNLNRNTIIKSLEELETSGWILVIPNKGSYVIYQKNDKINIKQSFPENAPFHFFKNDLFSINEKIINLELSIDFGKEPENYLENKLIGINFNGLLKRKASFDTYKSKNLLLKNLVNYLNITRGLNIKKDEIVVSNHINSLLNIICNLIFNKNDYVAIPTLSDNSINVILQQNGAKLVQIASDENGIIINSLKDICEKFEVKAIVLNTQNNFPSTEILSNDRRIELINLSKKYNFIIIELSNNFNFYYTKSPHLPLINLNKETNIIYLGNFGEIFPINFQLGFLVAPKDFVNEVQNKLYYIETEQDPLKLQLLSELIHEGEINRLEKKHRKRYKDKRNFLGNLLLNHLINWIDFSLPKSGFGFWLRFKIPVNLFLLKKDAENYNLFIPQDLIYQTKNVSAIRIGFAKNTNKELEQIILIIKECIKKQIKT